MAQFKIGSTFYHEPLKTHWQITSLNNLPLVQLKCIKSNNKNIQVGAEQMVTIQILEQWLDTKQIMFVQPVFDPLPLKPMNFDQIIEELNQRNPESLTLSEQVQRTVMNAINTLSADKFDLSAVLSGVLRVTSILTDELSDVLNVTNPLDGKIPNELRDFLTEISSGQIPELKLSEPTIRTPQGFIQTGTRLTGLIRERDVPPTHTLEYEVIQFNVAPSQEQGFMKLEQAKDHSGNPASILLKVNSIHNISLSRTELNQLHHEIYKPITIELAQLATQLELGWISIVQ